MKRLRCALVVMICGALLIVNLSACSGNAYIHNNSCHWRVSGGHTGRTRQMTTERGTERFYCRECVETCRRCGGRATTHRYNAMDFHIFLCRDCAD